MIIRALEEEQYDDLHMYFLKNTDKQSAKDEIINQLLMENEPLFEHDSEQKVYTVFLNDLRNRVKTSIDGYLLISELKTDTLANAYGRLDFMFGNRTIRKMAYKDIYDRIRELVRKAKEYSPMLKAFGSDTCNIAFCIDKLYELNDLIFTSLNISDGNIVDQNQDFEWIMMRPEGKNLLDACKSFTSGSNYNYVILYMNYIDRIEESIEYFRMRIYPKAVNEFELIPKNVRMINREKHSC